MRLAPRFVPSPRIAASSAGVCRTSSPVRRWVKQWAKPVQVLASARRSVISICGIRSRISHFAASTFAFGTLVRSFEMVRTPLTRRMPASLPVRAW